MAFKASNTVTATAFQRICEQANATKVYLTSQRALLVAATVNSTVPLSVIQHFASVIPTINTLAATPGLSAYAQSQLNDATYDIVTEFTAMRNAMISARNNLIAMFPKDGNGFLLYQTLNANGTITARTFTPAQVDSAVALIDSVISTIA